MIQIKDFDKLLKIDLDCNVDYDDNRLDFYGSSYWGADSKEDYEASEQKINDYKASGEGWELYCWCDVSGYDYWMIQQEESNYVSITVTLNEAGLPEEEFAKMLGALCKADDYFKSELEDFDKWNY